MKTLTILAVVLIELTTLKTNAQASCDMSAVIPVSKVAPKPIGFSLNVFSPSVIGLSNKGKKTPPPFNLRFGINCYSAGLDSRTIDNVPVSKPGSGLAKVDIGSKMLGVNFITRFEFRCSKIMVPYFDLFYGLRQNYVQLAIMPHDRSQKTGSQYAGSFSGANYGTAVGARFKLVEGCYADIGLVCSNSVNQEEMADIQSARVEGNDIVMDRQEAPSEIFMVKTGFVFCFNGSGGNCSHHHHYGHHSGCHIGGGSHVGVHI